MKFSDEAAILQAASILTAAMMTASATRSTGGNAGRMLPALGFNAASAVERLQMVLTEIAKAGLIAEAYAQSSQTSTTQDMDA